jgi:hypothetical protein
MDLVDALSGNTTAKSPVELSLNPAFRRKHHSVFDAIENFFQPNPSQQSQETDKTDVSTPAEQTQQTGESTLSTPDPQIRETDKACASPSAAQTPKTSTTVNPCPAPKTQEPGRTHAAAPAPQVRQSDKTVVSFPEQQNPEETNKTTESSPTPKSQRLEQEREMTRLIATTIPPLEKRSYHLLALDVTSIPRPFAHTLEDRVFTHSSNPVAGNRPVTIGHSCSVLAYIPEKKNPADPKWVVPLSARRVDSTSLETVVGAGQTQNVLEDMAPFFQEQLVVKVADSKYSGRQHVSQTGNIDNLVDIVRSAGNRSFYQSPPPIPEGQKRPANHPTWYGQKFSMKDISTWHEPDQTAQLKTTTKKGKTLTFHIRGWDNMLMKGKDGIDMHNHPFRLVCVTCVDDRGNPVYKRPMWLLVFGKRRNNLSLVDIVEAYLQRYDIEHFFRFGKQKLLLTAAQTPNVETEENWWQIVMLAYVQLWAARELAQQMPRPWENKPEPDSTAVASPTATQRDFERLTRQFGTPAHPPKPRGYSQGRKKDQKLTLRARQPVIKKGAKETPSP